MNRIIVENLSMTGILNWLTEEYKVKKSGEPFKLEDVQGYIRRKRIPSITHLSKIHCSLNSHIQMADQ